MPDIPNTTYPKKARQKPTPSAPPTIADLKGHGVTGVRLFCTNACGHRAVVSFELIRVDDGTPFPALRFKCSKCGGRDVHKMPDWPKPSDQMPKTWGQMRTV